MATLNNDIDFVVTWVDGGDPAWQELWREYTPGAESDDRPERYRDWDMLRFWFRGAERFAPWVRKIHLVTWGHLPDWLNTEHPKLRIVRHEDILPADALPTFNCNPLEVNLHRIEGLSQRFVYFNDDVLILNDVVPEDFFVEGRPRDMLAAQPVIANPQNPVMSHILLNDALVISRHFDKRSAMKNNIRGWWKPGYPPVYFIYNLLETAFPQYTGFYTSHGPSPMLRSTFEEIWTLEPETMKETTYSRFRSISDVNQYLFREWEKQKGNFAPANMHRDFAYIDAAETEKAVDYIRRQRRKMICVNDTSREIDFESARRDVQEALLSVLPAASSFEVQP